MNDTEGRAPSIEGGRNDRNKGQRVRREEEGKGKGREEVGVVVRPSMEEDRQYRMREMSDWNNRGRRNG